MVTHVLNSFHVALSLVILTPPLSGPTTPPLYSCCGRWQKISNSLSKNRTITMVQNGEEICVARYLVLRCREGMCGRASSDIPGTAFHTPGFGHVGPNAGTDQVHCSLQGGGCKPNPAAIYQVLLLKNIQLSQSHILLAVSFTHHGRWTSSCSLSQATAHC